MEQFERRKQYEWQHHPEAFHICKIKWDIFGCFTFKSERISLEDARKMFATALRLTFDLNNLYFPNAVWFRSFERGTNPDRSPHIHFLISDIRQRVNPKDFAAQLSHFWTKKGGGECKVEPYNARLNGALYVVKRSGETSGIVGQDFWDPTYSDTAFKRIKRLVKRVRGV